MLDGRPFAVLLMSVCVLAGCLACSARALAQDGSMDRPEVPIPAFMQELSNQGRWFSMDDWGWVWQPNDIEPWWVPYTHGEWRFTVQGPYWVSAKPYGWAVFHYGRWMHSQGHGWVWVPDTTWGPGFVCWRYGKGYLGWAPMPPEKPGDVGIATGACTVRASGWSFILARLAFNRYVEPHIVPRARGINLLGVTTSKTDYERGGLGWADRSIPIEVMRELTGMDEAAGKLTMLKSPPKAMSIRSATSEKAGDIPTYAPVLTGKGTFVDVQFTQDEPATSDSDQKEHPGFKVANHADAMRRAHEQLMSYQQMMNTRLRMMHIHDLQSPPWREFSVEELPAWQARELQEQAHQDAAQRRWVDERFLMVIAKPEPAPKSP